MVGKTKSEIKKKSDTIALYATIPRDIVMDDKFPFDRELEVQEMEVIIDEENNCLVLKPIKNN